MDPTSKNPEYLKQTQGPDWCPSPEYKENQTLLKIEPKLFIKEWCQQHNPQSPDRIPHLLKFLYLARQKKMLLFSDTHITLQKPHLELVQAEKGQPLEISYADLSQLIKSPDSAVVLDAF
jgi:hypothetical protein